MVLSVPNLIRKSTDFSQNDKFIVFKLEKFCLKQITRKLFILPTVQKN
jgi:hypothetical protein